MAPFCACSCISFIVILYTSCYSQIQPTSNTTDADYYIASAISTNITNTAFQDSSIYCFCKPRQTCPGVFVVVCGCRDCHIVCDTPNSCKDTTIYCWHGLCNITCSAENSCLNTVIKGHPDKVVRWETKDQITLTCTSNENESQPICSSLLFQYTTVSNLNIYANHQYAIYNSTFFANESYNIKLIASGALAYSANTLYGQDVSQSINITCASDRDSACYQSDWYLPTPISSCGDAGYCRDSKDYTFLNCYGKGCKNMGNIFISATNVLFNIALKTNGCGQCENIGECLGSFKLQCRYETSSTFNEGQCETYCSCSYWITNYVNASFSNDPSDQNCYAPIDIPKYMDPSPSQKGQALSIAVIAVIVVIVVLCILCIVMIIFCCKRSGTSDKANAGVEAVEMKQTIYAQTQQPLQPQQVQYVQAQPLQQSQQPLQQIQYVDAPPKYDDAPPHYSDAPPDYNEATQITTM